MSIGMISGPDIITGIDGRRSVLRTAEAWWDTRKYLGSGSLLDLSGNGHHAQLGSTAGADSNDPLFLPFAGAPYLYMPGVSGNYASVPDEAALDITGDIDLRAYIALATYTPAGTVELVKKWTGTGNQRSYVLDITTAGKLQIEWSPDGTSAAALSELSTIALGLAANAPHHVRVTLDVDNGAGGYTVTFYTSTDGLSWSVLGSPVVGGAPTSVYAGTAKCNVNENGSGMGAFYAAQVYNGIAGTKVLDIDFTDLSKYNAARTSLTAKTGQTVTINRSATGRKSTVVERKGFLGATDDYAEGSIALTAYPFTLNWVGRGYPTAAADALFTLADASAANVMYGIHTDASGNFGLRAQNTTAQDAHESGTRYDDGLFHSVVAVFRSAIDRELYIDGVSVATDTTSVTFNTALDVVSFSRWGDSSPSAYADCEFVGGGIFTRELSLSEIKRLGPEWAV